MRVRLLLGLLALAGCQGPAPLPPARLSLLHRAPAQEGGIHFTFAHPQPDGSVRYAHDVAFTLEGAEVRRVSFELRRKVPEAWALRWQDHTSKAIHEVVLVVLQRGTTPAIELLRPHPVTGPPFVALAETQFPELGARIGVYLGTSIRFQLQPDGSVTPLDPATPKPNKTGAAPN